MMMKSNFKALERLNKGKSVKKIITVELHVDEITIKYF